MESSWQDLVDGGATVSRSDLDEREASLQFDDPINIQYTSGTTGFPKGATLSHHNILNNGFFVGEGLNLTERDRVCIPVPFYHCFGMVLGNLACTTHGACMVIPGEALDPLAVMTTVQEERCTALYGTPTHFISELDHPDFAKFDFSSLRTGIMAGAPCPVEVMKNVLTKMHVPEITICYGMTETSPVSTQTRIGDPLEKQVGTVGRVHPHVEIKVVDPETGRIVPRGVPGELCTRGYSVMIGYWNNPEATSQAIDSARWMHTGDLAVMDDEGYCNIVGRIKDMIIRGGENIYPREVEEFLYRHPAVAEVSVIGVPSEKYGEEVMAWVKLRGDAECTEDELSRVLPREDRQLQDPALLEVHRLLPDDRHGQDPQSRDARDLGQGPRPSEGGPREDRLAARLRDRGRSPRRTALPARDRGTFPGAVGCRCSRARSPASRDKRWRPDRWWDRVRASRASG